MEKLDRFIELNNFDYETIITQKNIGDEARTFHIMEKTIPLLSPSRIKKIFLEHIFWLIPEKNLYKPRIIGKSIHTLIEFYFKNDYMVEVNEGNISTLLGNEAGTFLSYGKEEKKEFLDTIKKGSEKVLEVLKENNINIINSEKHIANNTFHGFVDLMGIKDNKEPIIIDIKTSSKKFEDTNEIKLQLGTYKSILENIPKTFIIHYNIKKEEALLFEIKEVEEVMKKTKEFINLFRKGGDYE